MIPEKIAKFGYVKTRYESEKKKGFPSKPLEKQEPWNLKIWANFFP
jgi:hypothetical protein